MAVLGAAAIAAAGSAYAANRQRSAARDAARAASQPSLQTVDQTTTQTGWDPAQEYLRQALAATADQYNQGPILRDPRTGMPIVPGAGGGKPRGGGGNKPGRGAGGAGGPSPGSQSRGLANDLINLGRTGNPNVAAADAFAGRSLEEGSYGGNEVYKDLAGRLANADLDSGSNMLERFIQGGGAAPRPANDPNDPYAPRGGAYSVMSSGGLGGAQGAGGPAQTGPMITDQTRGGGLFNDWARGALSGNVLDPNDPVLKDYLDIIQREGQEEADAQLQDLADEYEGIGMYGGSGLALERGAARGRLTQGIADARTKALTGFRGQGLDYMGNAAGLVNQRDIAGSSLASSEREGAANRSAAGADAAAGRDAQLQIANRGLDLEAIQSYLQNNQFGLGTLADVGRGVSADRFGAIDSLGAIDDSRYRGLETAYGVSREQAQADAARQRRRAEIAFANAQAPGQHLDEYLDRLGFFNNAGGTTRTTGTTNTTNPAAAAPYIAARGPGALEAGLTAGAGVYFQGRAARQGAATAPPAGRRNVNYGG